MENKKKGKGLVITLTILLVACAACAALLFTGVVKSPLVKYEDKTTEKTSTKTDDDTKKESTTDDDTKKSTTKVSDSDISKNTEIAADDCFRFSAKVVNGDIEVTGYDKTITIKVGNAKYLERAGFMACGTNSLFFINEEGQVYSIYLLEELLQTGDKTEYKLEDLGNNFTKVTNSNDKAVAFISNDSLFEKSNTDGYNYMSKNIAVLDEKGEVIVLTWRYFYQ